MNIKLILVALFMVVSCHSNAYQFEVEGLELGNMESPIHEQMTLLAAQCFLRYSGQRPLNCLSQGLIIKDSKLNFPQVTLELYDFKDISFSELMRATRWPDDPTRLSKLGNKRKTAIKSLGTKVADCKPSLLTWRFPFFRESDMTRNIIGGMFCSSHFGTMQFLHAMGSSSPDYDYQPEPFEASLSKAVAWGTFAMKAFRDQTLMEKELCTHFDEVLNDPARRQQHEFAGVFKLSDENLKKGRDEKQFHCENKLTIRFLFDNECKNIFSNKNCDPIPDDRVPRLAALGAILHMIQDSFSTSHTVRSLDLTNMEITKVYCYPVTKFFEYSEQMENGVAHNKSDEPPVKFDDSCFNKENPILDPITASAIALWYAAQNHEPNYSFNRFLAREVFGSSISEDTLVAELN